MEDNIVKTKKHLNLFLKALLFLIFSVSYFSIAIAVMTIASISYGEEYFLYPIGFIVPFAVIVFFERLLCKKTDMSLTALTFAPFALNLIYIFIYIISLELSGDYYAEENLIIMVFIIPASVLRGIIGIIDLIRAKKARYIPLCILAVVLCGLCWPFSSWYRQEIYYGNLGESDRTSSWNSINQMVNRDVSWQEIVTDTEFTLGEITKGLNDFNEEEYYCDKGTYPHIDGSTVCVPMAVEFARQHLNFDDQKSRDITSFSTTHWAYMNLIDKTDCGQVGFIYEYSVLNVLLGAVDLVIATHPSEEELKTAEEKGVELILEPVCYDAFVFITHRDNPVESLTVQQIKDIYSGKIKNWKDVGGKDEKIRAFQREANSGSQTAMERLVMGGTDMIDPIEVKVIEGMGELVDAVAEYENETASLGYTYRYYIDNLYKNDEIKTIAVEGVSPTDENIRSRAYPYTTNYYGVIRKEDKDRTGGKFLRWMLSEEGQKCVKQAGYIAMTAE